MKNKIRVLAISYAYVEPFTRIGFVGKEKDINLYVIIPFNLSKKNVFGYKKLLEENCNVILVKTYLNIHNSVHFYSIKILKYIKEIRPDIIFIGYEPWSSVSFEITLFCKIINPRIKIVVYTCENIVRNYPIPFNFLEQYVFKKVDLMLTVTKFEGEKVLRQKGYEGKVNYMPLLVDIQKFKKKNVSELRYNIVRNNKKVIGYVGRLVKAKGMYILLDLIKQLGEEYFLIIIGSGKELNNLREKVFEYKINDKVCFIEGVNHDDLVDYINCLDVLILPSLTTKNWKEQFGRVLIESMACCVPVIGSSSGEIPFVIEDCGLIFKEGDVFDLKNKVDKMFRDNIFREGLIMKAFKMVKTSYSKEIVYSRMAEIYRELLNENFS